MSGDRDIELGRLAIARGLVSHDTVHRAFRERGSASLRDELVRRGLITREQWSELEALLDAAAGVANAFVPPAAPEIPISQGATVPPEPGEAAPAVALPGIGDRVGEFEVTGLLGRGAMGMVVRARHVSTQEPVAIKFVTAYVDEDVLARFEREMEAMRRLGRSTNVVHSRAAGTFGPKKLPYAVMDLIEGHDLGVELADGPLPSTRAVEVVATVARAVHACHEAGVLHRDLKPDNILVRESDRQPFVADFGVARVSEMQRLTQTGQWIGTPLYMAPEQALGHVRDQDRRTDVYALGAILYQCLTGQPPHVAQTQGDLCYKIAYEAPADPSTLKKDLPPGVARIVLKCLAKERADRYQTALELAEDLRRIIEGEQVKVKLVTPDVVAVRAVKRNWRPVAAAIALALVTPAAWLGREVWRHSRIDRAVDSARAPGTSAERLARLGEELERLSAPPDVLADVRRRAAEAAYDEAAAELAPVAPATRDVPLLLRLAERARALPGHASLVGEREGLALGDALLDRRLALTRETGPSTEASDLLAAARRLVEARRTETPSDPAALLLRARARLAELGGPLRALGPGTLDLPEEAVNAVARDLAAARDAASLALTVRGEAAWLLVDVLVSSGPSRETDAQAALESARALAPDAAARAPLERALAGKVGPEAFAALVSGLGDPPAPTALQALSRFLARAGAPDGLEAAELVALPTSTAADLAAVLARDPAGAFGHVASPGSAPANLEGVQDSAESALSRGHNQEGGISGLIEAAAGENRNGAAAAPKEDLATRLRRLAAESWPDAARALSQLFRGAPWDVRTISLAGDTARPRLSRILFQLLESRIRERRSAAVSANFCLGERLKARDGLVSDSFPEEVFEFPGSPVRACAAFDERLARDLAADRADFLGATSPLDDALAQAERGARALRRLEALRPPESDDKPVAWAPGERERIAFEAIVEIRGLALLGGPLVLPFRAELRRLVFPGSTGEMLALLDLARARRAAAQASAEDRYHDYLLFALSRLVTLGESSPRLAPLRDDLGEHLFRLLVAWAHEEALRTAFHGSPEERLDIFKKDLGNFFVEQVTNRPSVRGVGPFVDARSAKAVMPTRSDIERLDRPKYERLPVTEEERPASRR
jgi:hypothetical protein